MISHFRDKYRPLSNFWYVKVWYGGIEYPTVEHAFQVAKTTDQTIRKIIQQASSPGEAKRLGRSLVKLRPDWEFIKLGVMERLLWQKFNYPELRNLLLSTGGEELIEGNFWHDQTWGVCYCNEHGGVGENNLGKLLMKIREELRNT